MNQQSYHERCFEGHCLLSLAHAHRSVLCSMHPAFATGGGEEATGGGESEPARLKKRRSTGLKEEYNRKLVQKHLCHKQRVFRLFSVLFRNFFEGILLFYNFYNRIPV